MKKQNRSEAFRWTWSWSSARPLGFLQLRSLCFARFLSCPLLKGLNPLRAHGPPSLDEPSQGHRDGLNQTGLSWCWGFLFFSLSVSELVKHLVMFYPWGGGYINKLAQRILAVMQVEAPLNFRDKGGRRKELESNPEGSAEKRDEPTAKHSEDFRETERESN